MGVWSPLTLITDARHHGVSVLGVDVNASASGATLERTASGSWAVRLGLSSVRTLGADVAARLADGRPYASMEDAARRAGLAQAQLEALATAGAFAGCHGPDRRRALWAAGAVAGPAGRLPGVVVGSESPPLPAMSERDAVAADLWATGMSPDHHPVEFARAELACRGVLRAVDLTTAEADRRVAVAGIVTHRQRPATAQGITFLNLEDETGLVNVICSREVCAHHRRVARSAAALVVRGRLERVDGVVNIVADRLEALSLSARTTSRDFR